MVVQHFQLTRERVALVDLDAAVGAGQGDRAGFHLAQFQDRVLHLSEQGVGGVGLEASVVLHTLARGVHQQVDVRLGLAAPGGEQPVADFLPLIAPRAARWLSRLGAITSNQYSAQGLTT